MLLLILVTLFTGSNASVSIKCTKSVSLIDPSPKLFQNSTLILSNLLRIQPDQIKFSKYEKNTQHALITSNAMNPFIHAVHLAYSGHFKLRLSPDMVWYVVCDGWAQYVKENSEKMRNVFVDFKGKKELVVVTGSKFEWSSVITEMNQQITNNTKQSKNLFSASFSTTTHESRTATLLARMDSMQKFFTFTVWTLCGIPEIELLGNKEDWIELIRRIEELVGMIEEWKVWNGNLKEIIGKFVEVYEGKVDLKFWNDIYKVGGLVGSGNPFITGWITNLFPYITLDNTLARNSHALDNHWQSKSSNTHHFTTNDFNPKLSKAPFNWIKNGIKSEMTFFGGMLGVGYDRVEKSVMPVFGYGVYKN